VKKTPELYIPEQNKKENYLNHELNDSDSMGNSLYQLTKELNTSFSKKVIKFLLERIFSPSLG